MTAEWRGILANIERAATAPGRAALGRFSIEGARLHERALAAGAAPEAALVAESFRRAAADRTRHLLRGLQAAHCRIHSVPDEVVSGLTEGRGGGAIVGLVRIPEPPTLDRALADCGGSPAILLVAVEVEEPGNVGALVRTALASGAAAFLAVGPSDPFHPKAVRTSMGSLFRLPVRRYRTFRELLDELRLQEVTTLGACASGGVPLPRLELEARSLALCVGSEAAGLSAEVRALLDLQVTIPMGSSIDSYSVNAAAAVILYELRRPR
jgi:TrmH family RNA methyltransferase